MSTLKQIQEQFQKSLLEGDLTILEYIPDSPRETRDTLLGLYQFAYRARLMEFLENDYPQLHTYLGDEQFAQMSTDYIAENPSNQPNARWYGNRLPRFLAQQAPYCDQNQIPDLAALENALNSVFDEADDPLLTLSHLSDIAPNEWAELVFVPVRATRRLDFLTNATELWNALASEKTPPPVTSSRTQKHYLIYRDDGQASFRSMNYEEAMMWDKMAAGVPFGVLCELLATYGGEDDAAMRAAGYLHNWIASDVIRA